jgi:predicted transcriptional regulator
MNDPIDQKIQTNICDILSIHPGIHLSKLSELLHLNINDVKEILETLEKNQIIFSIEQEGYKRYYLEDNSTGIRDKRMVHTKKTIYALIANNPGLHLSKIAEMLHMRLSLAEYHLRNMEQEQLVTSLKDIGYYKRYYITSGKEGTAERKIISLLREDIPVKIVLLLLRQPTAQHKDLLKSIDISSSTLSYHLSKLAQHGIIEMPLSAGEKGYKLINKQELIRLLKTYRLIPLTDSFTDIWDDLAFK